MYTRLVQARVGTARTGEALLLNRSPPTVRHGSPDPVLGGPGPGPGENAPDLKRRFARGGGPRAREGAFKLAAFARYRNPPGFRPAPVRNPEPSRTQPILEPSRTQPIREAWRRGVGGKAAHHHSPLRVSEAVGGQGLQEASRLVTEHHVVSTRLVGSVAAREVDDFFGDARGDAALAARTAPERRTTETPSCATHRLTAAPAILTDSGVCVGTRTGSWPGAVGETGEERWAEGAAGGGPGVGSIVLLICFSSCLIGAAGVRVCCQTEAHHGGPSPELSDDIASRVRPWRGPARAVARGERRRFRDSRCGRRRRHAGRGCPWRRRARAMRRRMAGGTPRSRAMHARVMRQTSSHDELRAGLDARGAERRRSSNCEGCCEDSTGPVCFGPAKDGRPHARRVGKKDVFAVPMAALGKK